MNDEILEDHFNKVSVAYDSPCEICGKLARTWVHQRERVGWVVNSSGTSCSHCGHAYELDFEDLPDSMRSVILSLTGCWAVKLKSWDNRLEVIRHVKNVLDLTLPQARQLVTPDAILSRGTKVEMRALAHHLSEAGASLELARSDLP